MDGDEEKTKDDFMNLGIFLTVQYSLLLSRDPPVLQFTRCKKQCHLGNSWITQELPFNYETRNVFVSNTKVW